MEKSSQAACHKHEDEDERDAKPRQQHWDLLSAVKVSCSSLILSASTSSLGKFWWLARIFSTRNRAASSMFMLSCNAEMRNRINSEDWFLEESKHYEYYWDLGKFLRGGIMNTPSSPILKCLPRVQCYWVLRLWNLLLSTKNHPFLCSCFKLLTAEV